MDRPSWTIARINAVASVTVLVIVSILGVFSYRIRSASNTTVIETEDGAIRARSSHAGVHTRTVSPSQGLSFAALSLASRSEA